MPTSLCFHERWQQVDACIQVRSACVKPTGSAHMQNKDSYHTARRFKARTRAAAANSCCCTRSIYARAGEPCGRRASRRVMEADMATARCTVQRERVREQCTMVSSAEDLPFG